MRNRKSITELNLIEDFLFTEASNDKETAELLMRLIIERATNLKVGRLVIEPQKTINGVDTDCHGIRLDVSVQEVTEEDGQTIQLFDIEPNNIKKVHLPKRSRFYQALADVKLLETGTDYDKLPDMWTIWILPYDPFGLNYMLYSVKNRVEESDEIEYNDGVRKLFLYTKGEKGGTKALHDLLSYLQNSREENAVDEELLKLHSKVERLKSSKEVGVKYMHMAEVIKYQVEEEVEEIIKELIPKLKEDMEKQVEQRIEQQVEQRIEQQVEQLRNETAQLTKQLLDEGRLEDLRRTTEDRAYLEQLLLEYKDKFEIK